MTTLKSIPKKVAPTPLKWLGAKSWLVERLKSIYSLHYQKRWVDVFCGSCALPLALQPNRVMVCDINQNLIIFWRWVQTDGKITIKLLNDRASYYQFREEFNSNNLPSSSKAQLFYYFNRSGFRGLMRENLKGEFNVPFGDYKKINYIKDFSYYQQIICNWEIVCNDFAATLNQIKPDDFLYIDPPYDGTFANYDKAGFSLDRQIELADMLAAKVNNPIVVSNSATPEMITLYRSRGFNIDLVEVRRRISVDGNRDPVVEILATKNLSHPNEVRA